MEKQPAWWKKVRTQLYKGKNEHVSNLKYCPSFVDVFRFSYVITSPCDWYFESQGGDDWKFDTSNEHLIKSTKHNLVTQMMGFNSGKTRQTHPCLLYTSPSPRDRQKSRMPSSA